MTFKDDLDTDLDNIFSDNGETDAAVFSGTGSTIYGHLYRGTENPDPVEGLNIEDQSIAYSWVGKTSDVPSFMRETLTISGVVYLIIGSDDADDGRHITLILDKQ